MKVNFKGLGSIRHFKIYFKDGNSSQNYVLSPINITNENENFEIIIENHQNKINI